MIFSERLKKKLPFSCFLNAFPKIISPTGRYKYLKFFFVFWVALGVFSSGYCQQQFRSLNREFNISCERLLNNKNNFSHTGFKPYLESKTGNDSLEINDTAHFTHRNYKRRIGRKLKTESLVNIYAHDSDSLLPLPGKMNFHLTIDPIFNFQLAKDIADTTLRADTTGFYTNSRGIMIRADFGEKVSVMSSFLENQSFFPGYIDSYVKNTGVVPGNGRVKPFKTGGYDYAMASGYVSFSPTANLNFQLGHDKNFIGDGYRSLLLSDNAFNYPFFRSTAFFLKNRIQYVNLYAKLSSIERIPVSSTPEALFKPLSGTFHYVSIIPWKHLHIGFFEGIIWPGWDSTGTLPFNWNFINPLIFSNSLAFGLKGKNNSLLGATLKLKILKGLSLYSQFVYDDKYKYGYQAGFKSFDLFTLKNLNFQVEFNSVKEKTYSSTQPLSGYYHYNQNLAVPLGENFKEIVFFIDYRWRDFFVQLKLNQASKYIDNLFLGEFRTGYVINRKTNMNLFAGFINRIENLNGGILPVYNTNQLFSFGLRTSLYNQYFDF